MSRACALAFLTLALPHCHRSPRHDEVAIADTPSGQQPAPSDIVVPRLGERELVEALDKNIAHYVETDRFAGAVILAKRGKILFGHAYGLANREKKIPNELGTQFRSASMGKMFTGVAVLQLIEQGKVRLADPLRVYLTDYPNQDLASRVTIHHLLTHTGGTGDIFEPEYFAHRRDLRTLRDYLALFGKRDVEFEPGSRFAYSNYGFVLLGLVIERASGQDFYAYVADHIFRPAGMASTGGPPEDEKALNRSIGYTGEGPERHPNTDFLSYRGTSAGGLYATVEDLVRFADALMAHRLLSAPFTEMLTTGKVTRSESTQYAYGFEDRTVNGLRSIGHAGGAPGQSGDLRIYPRSGYVIAVLSNLDPPIARTIADFADARLPLE